MAPRHSHRSHRRHRRQRDEHHRRAAGVDRPEFITETSRGAEAAATTEAPAGRQASRIGRPQVLVLAGVVAVGLGLMLSLSSGDDERADGLPSSGIFEREIDFVPQPFVGVERGEGPILARPAAFLLMVGGAQTLRTFDLTTGDLIGVDRSLDPRFVAGDWLIFRDDRRSWFWELLDGSGAPRAFEPAGAGAEVVPNDPSSIWLSWDLPDGGRSWQLIDLDTGEVARSASTSVDAKIPGAPCCAYVGPEVIGARGGGVFALDGGDVHRKVLDGDLIAAGDDQILVRQCNDQLRCESVWFEPDTWQRLDLPLPSGAVQAGRFVAGGTLLAGSEPRAALGSGLYDVATGRSLRSLGSTPIHDVLVSPDGAWMVRRLFGRIEVVDVATGEAVTVPGLEVGPNEGIVWVPRTDPADS